MMALRNLFSTDDGLCILSSENCVAVIPDNIPMREAWSKLSVSVSGGKTILLVRHRELGPTCFVWQTLGKLLQQASTFTAISAILYSTGYLNSSSNFAVPFALSSLTFSGAHLAFWRTRFFYSYYYPTEVISFFIRRIACCCPSRDVLLFNENMMTYSAIPHMALPAVAVFFAFCGLERMKTCHKRLEKWIKGIPDEKQKPARIFDE